MSSWRSALYVPSSGYFQGPAVLQLVGGCWGVRPRQLWPFGNLTRGCPRCEPDPCPFLGREGAISALFLSKLSLFLPTSEHPVLLFFLNLRLPCRKVVSFPSLLLLVSDIQESQRCLFFLFHDGLCFAPRFLCGPEIFSQGSRLLCSRHCSAVLLGKVPGTSCCT